MSTTEEQSLSQDSGPARPAVHTTIHKAMFPDGWPGKDQSVYVEQVPAEEHSRSVSLIQTAMIRYPERVLQTCVTDIYIVGRLVLPDSEPCGFTLQRRIYVINRGASQGFTDKFVQRFFHHEVAHNVFKLYKVYFSSRAWIDCTPGGFEYAGSVNEGLAHGFRSRRLDETLLADGFVNQMAQATLEEDFCYLTAELFLGDDRFWDAVARHELLRAKVAVAVEFLGQVDSIFTEDFFRTRRNARDH